ncbi:MAG: hypothetical protein EOO29_23995 [Comamonadaceae bacterium]|nr:MAG: hypothetical protein EOO29_23995 [Comamonadaceae bacterium]
MTSRSLFSSRPRALYALAGALLLAVTTAQAQTNPGGDQARVLSSTPITEQGQVTGYSVEYEFAGRRYTTRIAQPPGPTLPVQVSPMGVSTFAVAPPRPVTVSPLGAPPASAPANATPWGHVQPQPGVVLSAQGQAYGAEAVPDDMYAVPEAPVYGYAYPTPYPYAYPQPSAWAYPPVSLSFNLGYSRGWRGGYRGYGGRGYHGRGWR